MSTELGYPHLSTDSDGVVRIEQTRYKVLHLATEHFHFGWTAEELLRQHPDLRPEQVYSALTYFYDHRDAMIVEMKASYEEAVKLRPQESVSRSELATRH